MLVSLIKRQLATHRYRSLGSLPQSLRCTSVCEVGLLEYQIVGYVQSGLGGEQIQLLYSFFLSIRFDLDFLSNKEVIEYLEEQTYSIQAKKQKPKQVPRTNNGALCIMWSNIRVKPLMLEHDKTIFLEVIRGYHILIFFRKVSPEISFRSQIWMHIV